jgi:hypothetical protein
MAQVHEGEITRARRDIERLLAEKIHNTCIETRGQHWILVCIIVSLGDQ